MNRTKKLVLLIESGYLDEYRSAKNIKSELTRIGGRAECKHVETNLLRLVENNVLDRRKDDVEGRKVWVYIKNEKCSPENEKEYFFQKSSKFDFYTILKKLIQSTKGSILIVDAYITEDIFDLYIHKLERDVQIKILTNPHSPKDSFYKIAQKFKSQHSLFEVRENEDCHDRMIFIDGNAWVFGQSIKAAGNKPTYLIKLEDPAELRKIIENMWNFSKKSV